MEGKLEDASAHIKRLQDLFAEAEARAAKAAPGSLDRRAWPEERKIYLSAIAGAMTDAIGQAARLRGEKPLPKYDRLRNAIDAGASGFLAMGPDVAKAAGIAGSLLPGIEENNALMRAADDLEEAIRAAFPGDPARAEEFLTSLASGAGSMASFLVGGGAVRGAARLTGATAGMIRGTGAGTNMLLGAAAQGTAGYEDALAMGAGQAARYTAFFLNAGLGVGEAIPIDRFFGRLNRASGGGVARLLADTGAQSLDEFMQETLASFGHDVIAKAIHDLERKTSPRTI